MLFRQTAARFNALNDLNLPFRLYVPALL
jgi:hypothetical protein